MEELVLEAHLREESGKSKVKSLRRQGFIPAVLYGEGKKPQAIKISSTDLIRLIHQHHAETAVVNLKIKDEAKKAKEYSCLIKDIQYDPVKSNILHVDFNQISLTRAIKVNVPVVSRGEPIGVRQDGGSLSHILWEVEVECLPKEIPREITVDVSNLKINDTIHIKDLGVPSGVKILSDAEAIVFSVVPPVKEEVVIPAEEAGAPTEPEVIREKKEVPEEEGKEEPKEKEKDRGKEKEGK
jgi:large subunit ribosomal protein L25